MHVSLITSLMQCVTSLCIVVVKLQSLQFKYNASHQHQDEQSDSQCCHLSFPKIN